MLGQPSSMLIPPVLGYRLTGALPEGATATDLVLTITEALRKKGVVGKFVEFYGPGLKHLTIADRATLGNMCPEYGATVAIFPIDDMTLDYLRADRPRRRAGRARRGVRQGAGAVPHRRDARRGLQRDARARPRDGRAEPRRARGGRRIACRCSKAKTSFAAALPDLQKAVKKPAAGAAVAARRSPWQRRSQRPRARLGGHRRDHQLHEHVEPERDDRRRPAREEGGGARPDAQAVGEDEPGARVEGRDRVPAQGRASTAVSRSARVQPGRLRLHDVHRQQRPAARRDRRGGPRARVWWSRRC